MEQVAETWLAGRISAEVKGRGWNGEKNQGKSFSGLKFTKGKALRQGVAIGSEK